ncbi:alcohol dehydrogenase catalytic domain-containing protein [Streptomyces sp. PT12]|uniref:alcohol dehydrogenase catalytic domain-containing protein n=1 Tax=Streptomyces sp. PT12 TaxID=1510197 RepID=UPI0034D979BA
MPGPEAPLERWEFSRPDREPGAILSRTLGSGVCGTDAHPWQGQPAGVPYPINPGHVSVGRIAVQPPSPARAAARPASRAFTPICQR